MRSCGVSIGCSRIGEEGKQDTGVKNGYLDQSKEDWNVMGGQELQLLGSSTQSHQEWRLDPGRCWKPRAVPLSGLVWFKASEPK